MTENFNKLKERKDMLTKMANDLTGRQKENDAVVQIALQLYLHLPFWKRWQAARYYKSNNWDVTGVWKDCLHQARKMMEEG